MSKKFCRPSTASEEKNDPSAYEYIKFFLGGAVPWSAALRNQTAAFPVFRASAAQGGIHANGRRTYGHSMLIDPWGAIVVRTKADPPRFLDRVQFWKRTSR